MATFVTWTVAAVGFAYLAAIMLRVRRRRRGNDGVQGSDTLEEWQVFLGTGAMAAVLGLLVSAMAGAKSGFVLSAGFLLVALVGYLGVSLIKGIALGAESDRVHDSARSARNTSSD